jgi:putative transposase
VPLAPPVRCMCREMRYATRRGEYFHCGRVPDRPQLVAFAISCCYVAAMNPSVRRKRVRHFHEPGDLHELTFSCYQRMPLLTNDDWRIQLARAIDTANREEQMGLVAFVFMPEHVHLLICTENMEPNLSRYLAIVKQPFSKTVKQRLVQSDSRLLKRLTVQERPGKYCFRFWQEGPGFDRNLNAPEAIAAAIDYIHSNPVKRGLCARSIEWKWSSARWYLCGSPKSQDPDLPHIHGLPRGALDR